MALVPTNHVLLKILCDNNVRKKKKKKTAPLGPDKKERASHLPVNNIILTQPYSKCRQIEQNMQYLMDKIWFHMWKMGRRGMAWCGGEGVGKSKRKIFFCVWHLKR